MGQFIASGSYRRAGVLEYIVWRTEDRAVDWWVLEEDEFRPLPCEADGVMRSRAFPGLWMNVEALLTANGLGVMAKLQEGLHSPLHAAFLLKEETRGAGMNQDMGAAGSVPESARLRRQSPVLRG